MSGLQRHCGESIEVGVDFSIPHFYRSRGIDNGNHESALKIGVAGSTDLIERQPGAISVPGADVVDPTLASRREPLDDARLADSRRSRWLRPVRLVHEGHSRSRSD